MKNFLSLIIVSFVFCIGCSSSPVAVDHHECKTVGTIDNVYVDYLPNGFTVRLMRSVTTDSDIYFYLNDDYINIDKQMIIPIPDSVLYVDNDPFSDLSAFISQDATGKWYAQIIRNGGNMSMSVGAQIVIKEFTVTW